MTHRLELTPSETRTICWWRQGGLCALCWTSVGTLEDGNFEAHHRLRRRDLQGWCPCNIVALHPRCHTQGPRAVHDNPELALRLGLILYSSADPREELVSVQWPWIAPSYLDCAGDVVSPHHHGLASPTAPALPLDV